MLFIIIVVVVVVVVMHGFYHTLMVGL